MGRPREDRAVKWWRKVLKLGPDECWPWQGAKTKGGYGLFEWEGPPARRCMSAHAAGYRLLVGPVTEGWLVRHTCDNPPCCNPAHWELGTAQDNSDDMVKRGRQGRTMGNQPFRPRQRKVTDDMVRAIRADDRHYVEIAYIHRISPTTVLDIKAGRRKAHVPD
jgi:hypothetical protein